MKKQNGVSYILLLMVLITVMFAVVLITKSIGDITGKIENTQSPSVTNSPYTEMPSVTPVITDTPTPTPTTIPTPTPTPTPTPLPIIDEIDVTKLEGLDTSAKAWWNNPYKDMVKTVEKYGGIYKKNEDKKVIYLTIDEGYENGYTADILDTLKEKNVKTIFFITGTYLRDNPELIKRMVQEGHLVGNHTNNHPSMPKQSVQTFVNELVTVEKLYEKLIGEGNRMNFYRPPAGGYSERDLCIAQQMGYSTVFWSFTYSDYLTDKQPPEQEAFDNIINSLHNGEVLLLHAVSKTNTAILGRIIDRARELGYEFRRIDE